MTAHKILLVDDDEDDRMLFIDALSEIDNTLQCDVANNGLDALDRLEKISLPSLVFLDMNMPKMNGYNCLVEIKKRTHLREIPIIIYSTSNSKSQAQRFLQAGAASFLIKPSDFRDLKRELLEMVEKYIL